MRFRLLSMIVLIIASVSLFAQIGPTATQSDSPFAVGENCGL